jgi:leucyl aminopeptidase
MIVKTAMKFNRGALSGSLAMALASTRIASAFVPHQLMTTSLAIGQASAITYNSGYTVRSMSKMDQSFKTWSFDEACTTMAWTDVSEASLSVVSKSDNWEEDADLVVVGVFAPKKDESEDKDKTEHEDPTVELSGAAKDLDEKLGGALSNVMLENAKAFKNGASAGSVTPTLRLFKDGKSQRVVVIGLGILDEEKDHALAGVGSALGKALATTCNAEKKVKTTKVLLPESVGSNASLVKDFSTTFFSTLYSDNRFRTKDNKDTPAEDLETLTIVSEGSSVDGVDEALDAGKKLASGIHMTKDIVNAPHNVLNSLSLADTAKRIAEGSDGSLKCEILGKEECEERGMGAYIGVARGSETPPQFIHLTYTPSDGVVHKKVGVVGKGTNAY